MNYNLFLDDIRNVKDAYIYPIRNENGDIVEGRSLEIISNIPRFNWITARSYEDFVATIEKNGLPEAVSFDHDLHQEHMDHYFAVTSLVGIVEYGNLKVKTGKHCAEYFVDKWKDSGYTHVPKVFVHSANRWGADEIRKVLNKLYD